MWVLNYRPPNVKGLRREVKFCCVWRGKDASRNGREGSERESLTTDGHGWTRITRNSDHKEAREGTKKWKNRVFEYSSCLFVLCDLPVRPFPLCPYSRLLLILKLAAG